MKIFLLILLIALSSAEQSLDQESIMEMIMNDIAENKIMLYSKSYCRYSRQIKSLLRQYPLADSIKTIELNYEPNGREMLKCLENLSGIRTVPQLFVNGTFIGGYTDTQELEDQGKFREILEVVGLL